MAAIWGAYIAAYGFNNIVPARGGDVIKLFLVKTLDPAFELPRGGRVDGVEMVFDAQMGRGSDVRVHARGVPQAAGLRESRRLRPVLFASTRASRCSS